MSPRLVRRTEFPNVPPEDLFRWHERPNAFARLTPPWEEMQVLEQGNSLRVGEKVVLKMKRGPAWFKWVARHVEYDPPHSFKDVQESGPFTKWEHSHRVLSRNGGTGSALEDDLYYRLPMQELSSRILGKSIREDLEQVFRYRHAIMRQDMQWHSQWAPEKKLRVAITGSSGLVGEALTALLTTGGHEVIRLVRSRKPDVLEKQVVWNTREGIEDLSALEGLDAVVHLAGEGIASKRWNAEQKRKIRDSRIQGTTTLVEALGRLNQKPETLICASAIGIYGNRGAEVLDEEDPAGPESDFLVQVAKEWEDAAARADAFGIRVAQTRFGIILSPAGGALQRMAPLFKIGAGGRLGSGKQYMSWVALDDVLGAIYFLITHPEERGAYNVTAPNPATNRDFTKTLASVLNRPVGPPAPAIALRAAFGELADAGLLASTRVLPRRLQNAGYEFLYPSLESALRHQMGRCSHPAGSPTGATS